MNRRAASAKASPSLKQLAIRGVAWTTVGHAVSMGLRLVSNLILTRLLFPEAFGLMAIVNIVRFGLEMFTDIGAGPAILRDEQGDEPKFYNTAWTMQVVRGFGLCAVACALAWPIAKLYEQPDLVALIAVAGSTAIIAGFNSTAIFTLTRHMELGKLTLLGIVEHLCGLIVTVCWAYLSPSVWALVAGLVSGALCRMLWSHRLIPGYSNRFVWNRDALKKLIRFGKWIFLSSAFYFASTQMDRILLGHYTTISFLGIYSVATLLSEALVLLIYKTCHHVVYPAFGRVFRDEPHNLKKVYYKARLSFDLALMPGLGVLTVVGAFLVQFLYDERYADAGWMFQLLCIRVAMRSMLEPCEMCLVAIGQPRYAFFQQVARFIWVLVGIPVMWHYAGIEGLVWTAALSEVPALLVLWSGALAHRLLSFRRELASFTLFLGTVAIGKLILRMI